MYNPVTRGRNISHLQLTLLDEMDGDDATRLMTRVEQLMEELPNVQEDFQPRQGLLLGLVQSGKTVALTTTIAMAADNGYKCFIVLTSDNLWLYEQTISRLKQYLQGMQVEGKQQWDGGQLFMFGAIQDAGPGLVLVTTKNASVLNNLTTALDELNFRTTGFLPPTLIIDDEADQASLDTQTSKRTRDSSVLPGKISSLIGEIRQRFPRHVLLQVTATPQALFLQDVAHPYRPEFTILIEPGKGYIGGNTFFSLDTSRAERLIRHINQIQLDLLLSSEQVHVPPSLWNAVCTFFVGATIKYLQYDNERRQTPRNVLRREPKYSLLCHISFRKADHAKAYEAIVSCHKLLAAGLSMASPSEQKQSVKDSLRSAYDDLLSTLDKSKVVTFDEVVAELQKFVIGTDVQILNSDSEKKQPSYDRRYNILIGGNKLARGVTIPNLIVTYYGRQAKSPNMDTVLQHARMYGYRERDLDVTRLFLTPDIERRFRLINESEQALRGVIEEYPDQQFQGIRIGPGIKATRSNVLNPNNIGSYVAGRHYFPKKPLHKRDDIHTATSQIDEFIDRIQPENRAPAIPITTNDAVKLLRMIKADATGSGLWDTPRIIAGLETLKQNPVFGTTVYLVVRRNRRLSPNTDGEIRSILGGASGNYAGDMSLANKDFPTLFMYRLTGTGWDGYPFWMPAVRFPNGRYALLFNFD